MLLLLPLLMKKLREHIYAADAATPNEETKKQDTIRGRHREDFTFSPR